MKHRYAVDYAVWGDARFCAHRDMIRLFARAMARAGIPNRFSDGFNPHPKFSLQPPRPVGVATDADRLVVELTEPMTEEELLRRLGGAMPRGIAILRARRLDDTEKCRPQRVSYLVDVPSMDRAAVSSRATQFTGSGPVFVQRESKKDGARRAVDIAPFVDALHVTEQGIAMTLLMTPEGSAKPIEVCTVLGLTDEGMAARIRRVRVEWM